MENKWVAVRIPSDLWAEIKGRAEQQGQDVGEFLRGILIGQGSDVI